MNQILECAEEYLRSKKDIDETCERLIAGWLLSPESHVPSPIFKDEDNVSSVRFILGEDAGIWGVSYGNSTTNNWSDVMLFGWLFSRQIVRGRQGDFETVWSGPRGLLQGTLRYALSCRYAADMGCIVHGYRFLDREVLCKAFRNENSGSLSRLYFIRDKYANIYVSAMIREGNDGLEWVTAQGRWISRNDAAVVWDEENVIDLLLRQKLVLSAPNCPSEYWSCGRCEILQILPSKEDFQLEHMEVVISVFKDRDGLSLEVYNSESKSRILMTLRISSDVDSFEQKIKKMSRISVRQAIAGITGNCRSVNLLSRGDVYRWSDVLPQDWIPIKEVYDCVIASAKEGT